MYYFRYLPLVASIQSIYSIFDKNSIPTTRNLASTLGLYSGRRFRVLLLAVPELLEEFCMPLHLGDATCNDMLDFYTM